MYILEMLGLSLFLYHELMSAQLQLPMSTTELSPQLYKYRRSILVKRFLYKYFSGHRVHRLGQSNSVLGRTVLSHRTLAAKEFFYTRYPAART